MKRLGLLFGLFASFSMSGPAQDTPAFTGEWELNIEESDDAQAKMEEMREKLMSQRGGSGGMGGPGGRRRGGGGPPGGMGGRGGQGGNRPSGREGRGPEAMMGGMRQPQTLNLELTESELHVDSGESIAIFYLDGDKHERQNPQGRKVETVASLRGNAVVIEEVSDGGRVKIEATRRFELSPDGDRLVVTVQMKPPRTKDPIIIRSVYDAVHEQ